ncbi:sensor histidine kinase [Grimontia hollisae]|uniref:histidine kinase n=3 Tax=Grimontia hollisae TaxID=673 RepID=D0I920_GRIHO|nr:sensor histidine kinase [Grimontia hollisae]EEY71935.1 signal transduction histidine kinase [Grimontia hollisae CIP 101886]AMG29486.1 sensor histidine kinase [Grimontia hollisae]STO77393.1 Sensor protein qseC [Grimontia hollisae]STO98447.1 Sensor protein qseC [Grimontia hollisae]STQ75725.1 Sensor protein qseC [Grimontia hollisae]
MSDKKPFSMKRNLIVSAVLLCSLLICVSLYFVYKESRHEINEVYDAHLGQSAKTLALAVMNWGGSTSSDINEIYRQWQAQINVVAIGSDDFPTPYGHPYENNILFQYVEGHKVKLKSPNAPETFLGKPGMPGFANVEFDGMTWRVFQLPFNGGEQGKEKIILVAEKEAIRQEFIEEVSLSIGLPLLVLIPLLMVLLTLSILMAFRPISELRAIISEKHINNLERIKVAHPTTELAPLVDQINYLFQEVEQVWKREKRLISTAAHELKTPLAVIRLDTENALLSPLPADSEADLRNILKGIDRADRLIQQLLMFSRVEQEREVSLETFDVVPVIRDCVASLVPMALTHSQSISLNGEHVAMLTGHPAMLSILVANLIDNAIRYSGDGADIAVDINRGAKELVVSVTDSGIPMREDVKARLFEKFYRGNTETGDGAGLGMSIVEDIAMLHHAKVFVESPVWEGSGNRFRVVFPV